jgi:hypothetical protein
MNALLQQLENFFFFLSDLRFSIGNSLYYGLKKMWWLIPIAGTGAIFYLFFVGAFPLEGANLEERGQFGDSFGVLNSLFTGLGFGGLIVTLVLQQKQISHQEQEGIKQRRSEEKRHYEETLHRLLDLYSKTLADVFNAKGTLSGRSVLRGSTDRVFEAIKDEKVNLIPLKLQQRFECSELTEEDQRFLDYLYFRNFKILSVEIDRQGRLVDTLKVLMRHLIYGAPDHLLIKPYSDLFCAQITYIEVSYFFLIALTFKDEDEFRELFSRSGLIEKAAYVRRLKVHDYMYQQFWNESIRQYKEPIRLPMSDKRINEAVRTFRKQNSLRGISKLKSYTSPRTRQDAAKRA